MAAHAHDLPPPLTKRLKLSSDNLLAALDNQHGSPALRPPAATTQQTPTLSGLDIGSGSAKRKSTNSLLESCESPTLVAPAAAAAAARLSTDGSRRGLNNVSNNNLSTSASLLDATTDDAMSSKWQRCLFFFEGC